MIPTLWGPNFWYSIFCIATTYPKNPTREYILNVQLFFKSFRHILPCDDCKKSYNKYSNENDSNIDNISNFETKDKFIKLIYIIRSKVNKKIGYDYKINFDYFKNKICYLSCYNKDTTVDITKLREVPFIPDKFLKSVLLLV